MLNKNKKLALASLLLLFSTPSLASTGGIIFGPVSAAAVPAMSDSMLVVLGCFLIFMAYRVLKQRTQNKAALWVTLLGTSTLLATAGKFTIVESTVASFAVPIIPNTTLVLNPSVLNVYWNNTPAPLQVKSVTLGTCTAPTGVPLCAVGLVISADATCEVDCRNL